MFDWLNHRRRAAVWGDGRLRWSTRHRPGEPMVDRHLPPRANAADPEVVAVRIRAEDHWRAAEWADLLGLESRLRRDVGRWRTFWVAMCAVASRRLGDGRARKLLDETIRGGFMQAELLDGKFEAAFGEDEDWAAVVAAL